MNTRHLETQMKYLHAQMEEAAVNGIKLQTLRSRARRLAATLPECAIICFCCYYYCLRTVPTCARISTPAFAGKVEASVLCFLLNGAKFLQPPQLLKYIRIFTSNMN